MPAVDGRGSEADADADRDAGGRTWFGLGLVDGVGNTDMVTGPRRGRLLGRTRRRSGWAPSDRARSGIAARWWRDSRSGSRIFVLDRERQI